MEIDLGRLLDVLPGLVWTALPDGRAGSFGRRWLDYTGVSIEEAAGHGWTGSLHPDDAPRLLTAWKGITGSGDPGQVEARLRRRDGEYRWQRTMVIPLHNTRGDIEAWCGLSIEIEEARHAQAKLSAEKQLLEFVAKGRPLLPTLETLCRQAEGLARDSLCAILLTDVEGRAFRIGAAPSLPAEYVLTLEGRPIDPADAPSALAVTLKAPVIVGDLLNDSRWAASALPRRLVSHGLRSCWAMPILSGANRVLGVFAAYHRQIQEPTNDEHELIERFAHIAGIAIERDQAESALKESEAKLRRAYDSLAEAQRLSHTGSFITDLVADGHDWSEEAYRIFGFDPAEPPSLERIRALVHADDVAGFDAMIAKAMTGADVDFIFRVRTAQGTSKHVRGLARVTEKVAGRPQFVGALQDVTESKLIEAALMASEAELKRANRHLLEAQRLSKTSSFTWDVEADQHDWSDEQRRMWEFDPAVRITMPMILSAVHPDDMCDVETVIAQAVHGDGGFEVVFRILTRSGELKHLHCVAHRIEQISDRPVFLGAIQDITERKVAEEALERARAELAHVARFTTLSALTASIAHEVNQPLAGIITNASTCLRMLAADPPNVAGARSTAERTIRDGNRAKDVIQRLRALFAHKAAAFEPIDLNSVASDVLALSSSELQAARVVATCELARELPPVSGDRVQLQQVILNLLSNAADAMREVVDRPRTLTIGTRRDATDRVVMSVRDSGVGFEPDHLERMFDAFYTTKTHGMGVGLAISRSIIESHGGRLWAKLNQNSPGAEFGFWIPPAIDALSFGGEATRII